MSISASSNDNVRMISDDDVFPKRGSRSAVSFVGTRQLAWNASPQKYVVHCVKTACAEKERKKNHLLELIEKVLNLLNHDFESNAKTIISTHLAQKNLEDTFMGLPSISELDAPYQLIQSNLSHFNGNALNLEALGQSIERLKQKAQKNEAITNIFNEIITQPNFEESPVDCIRNWMQAIKEKELLTSPEMKVRDFFIDRLENTPFCSERDSKVGF